MTSADRWLTVIGIGEDGPDGLSAVAREALAAADILVGGRRPLAMVPDDGQACTSKNSSRSGSCRSARPRSQEKSP